MSTLKRSSLLFLLMSSLVGLQAKELRNLDRHDLAVQGYDVVAYFTDAKPVKGDPMWTSVRGGATYRFASPAHKAAFDADPAKYEPEFGGYCAYGVSKGKLVEIDPEAFQVVEGRLLLQYSKGVRTEFSKDVAGNLRKAQDQWPALLERKGR